MLYKKSNQRRHSSYIEQKTSFYEIKCAVQKAKPTLLQTNMLKKPLLRKSRIYYSQIANFLLKK